MGKVRTTSAIGVTLLVVLAAFAAQLTAAGAVTSSVQRFVSPEDAVSAGALDQHVLDVLDERGSVSAIVSIDGAAALASAKVQAPQSSRPSSDPSQLLARTIPAYTAMKEEALADARVVDDFPALPTSLVRFDSRAQLLDVLNSADVASVRTDERREVSLAQSLPLVDQPEATAGGHSGAGTSVAVMDTGVDYARAAFGSCVSPGGSCRVAYAADFAPGDGSKDADGHGTNVAGIVVGVAPSTKILALDVFDGNFASDSDMFSAINWVIQNKTTYGTRAVNLSLGDSSYHTSACTGSSYSGPFSNLRAAGILPVVAAGNDGYVNGNFRNGVGEPACAPGAIRVGAVYDSNIGGANWGDCNDSTTAADKITCFSQTGSLLSLWAPGSDISAAGVVMSGTSQATPHVAGAVAVLAAASPASSVTALQTALESAGPSITDARNGVSRHRLDLDDAVASLLGGSPSPTPTPTPTPGPGVTATATVGALSGYYAIHNGYRLYWRKDAKFAAYVSPSPGAGDIGFEWQKRNVNGRWVTLADQGFAMDSSGGLQVYIPNSSLAYKVRYRIRAYFMGDASYAPSSTAYSYFRVY